LKTHKKRLPSFQEIPSLKSKCLQDATAATEKHKLGFILTARRKLTTASKELFVSDTLATPFL